MACCAAHSTRLRGALDPHEEDLIHLRVHDFLHDHPWFSELQEDFEQEALLRWWRVRDRHDPDRGSLETFLRWVTDNACRDYVRRHVKQRGGREQPLSLDLDQTRHEDRNLARALPNPYRTETEALRAVYDANVAQRLTPRDRHIYRRLLDDRSVAEIARELGLHRDTVNEARRRIRRAYVEDRENE